MKVGWFGLDCFGVVDYVDWVVLGVFVDCDEYGKVGCVDGDFDWFVCVVCVL